LLQPLTGTAGGFCGMNGLGRKFVPLMLGSDWQQQQQNAMVIRPFRSAVSVPEQLHLMFSSQLSQALDLLTQRFP